VAVAVIVRTGEVPFRPTDDGPGVVSPADANVEAVDGAVVVAAAAVALPPVKTL